MVEALSFLTDIRKTPQGEMRDGLRGARVSYDCQYQFDDAQNAAAESMLRDNPAGDWLLPIWPELTAQAVPVGPGATVFAVDDVAAYAVDGLAYLESSEGEFLAATVASIGAGSIAIAAPCPFAVAWVMPIGLAYMLGGLSARRFFRGFTVRGAKFELRDRDDLAATPFDQFLGFDVLTDASVISNPIEASIAPARAFIDNGLGRVEVEPLRDIIDATAQLVFKDFGAADMARRRAWFCHLRGRDRAFWLPTWADDFALAAPVAFNQAFIDVAPLAGDMAALVGRCILIADGGAYIPRLIEAAALAGGLWRLTIEPTGRDISAAQIMFLDLVRLDADTIELARVTFHYMETSVTVAGLPNEF